MESENEATEVAGFTVQSSRSVVVWLCDPMDCSTPGFPLHHQQVMCRRHSDVQQLCRDHRADPAGPVPQGHEQWNSDTTLGRREEGP